MKWWCSNCGSINAQAATNCHSCHTFSPAGQITQLVNDSSGYLPPGLGVLEGHVYTVEPWNSKVEMVPFWDKDQGGLVNKERQTSQSLKERLQKPNGVEQLVRDIATGLLMVMDELEKVK